MSVLLSVINVSLLKRFTKTLFNKHVWPTDTFNAISSEQYLNTHKTIINREKRFLIHMCSLLQI